MRTQAALALGASVDPEAARPLCDALDDPNDTVRSAAAAGLGKLARLEGTSCLRRHQSESNPAVRSVIARSLQLLASAQDPAPTKTAPPSAKDAYYVAIGPVTDRSGRLKSNVGSLVRSVAESKLLSLTGYALAPQGESPATAKAILRRQKKLRGYYLQLSVEAPRYAAGDLSVLVRVTMWSYPARSLQGEFSPRLTMAGVSLGDTASEDALIRMAVERAIESFAQVSSAAGNVL